MTAMCHVGSSQELDYDTARQFVWAFHVAYSEKLRKRDPTAWVDEDAFYKTRKLEELSGWIESGSGRMPIEIEIALSLMTEILFLDLRQGTLLNIESDGQQRPFLPTDHQRDENLRANYNPVKLQDRFERLRRYLNKKATSK